FRLIARSASAISLGSSLDARFRKWVFIASVLVSASVRKNWRVDGVSFGRVSYDESLASARDRAKIALSASGIEECVDVPRAVSTSDTLDLSAVEMLTYCTVPAASLMIQPPSFSANSQSILLHACSARNRVP